MKIKNLNDQAIHETFGLMIKGMKSFVENNPDSKRDLVELLASAFDNADCEDFFGTEGWQAYFGLSDY